MQISRCRPQDLGTLLKLRPASASFSLRGSPEPAVLSGLQTAGTVEDRQPQKAFERLWLAVHFPYLAVEAAGEGDQSALAIVEPSRKGWVVYQACPRAERFGIRSGITSSAANALHHGLTCLPRNPALEQRLLEQRAGGMLSFTPTVSIAMPDTLLLEISPSLKLFGGYPALTALIKKRLRSHDCVFRTGTAATPKAATLLALMGDNPDMAADQAAIRSKLGAIPTSWLLLDEKVKKRLYQTGINTLKDLWRLPRDGLSRRYGKTLLHYLEQILGERPDPQTLYKPPFSFYKKLEFDYASSDLAQLRQAANQLLERFVGYLRGCDRGTNAFALEFFSGTTLRKSVPGYRSAQHHPESRAP